MTIDTVQHQLPYKYTKLPHDRVCIQHPAGPQIILPKNVIINRLEDGKSGIRELSAHEVLMLEQALVVANNERSILDL